MRIPSIIQDDRGITLPLFAILAFTLVSFSLAGLDFMRFHMVQSRVQAAMDAAVLAAGRRLDSDNLQEDMTTFFWANVEDGFMDASIHDLQVSDPQGTLFTGQTITTTLHVELPLLVSGFIDATSWSFDMKTVAKREATDLELVLAMDNTGSMEGSKLTDMKSAAKTLIASLLGNETAGEGASNREGLYFATVPFTTNVRLPKTDTSEDATYKPVSWLKTDDVVIVDWHTRYKEDFFSWRDYPIVKREFEPDDWNGCIMENTKGLTTDLDTDPVSLVPQRIEPVEVCTEWERKWGWTKCTKVEIRQEYIPEDCSMQRASPLDADSTKATKAIEAMEANGATAVVSGMLWGWRMLSHDWDQSHDWGSTTLPQEKRPTLTKAVVLLTDGENDVGRGTVTLLGETDNEHAMEGALDTALEQVCTDAKDDGIVIYSITFGSGASGGRIRELMEDCATDAAHFYNAPTTDQLKKAFTAIGGSLSRLSLIE